MAGLYHSVSRQTGPAEVCLSNIDTHGLGTHAVGTIPMTLQLGMLHCCTATEAKEDYGRGGFLMGIGGRRVN